MTPIEQALRELVSLKDLKDAAQALPGEPDGFGVRHIPGAKAQEMMAEYERRKPAAWKNARAALASLEAAKQEPLTGDGHQWLFSSAAGNSTCQLCGARWSPGFYQPPGKCAPLATAPSPGSGT